MATHNGTSTYVVPAVVGVSDKGEEIQVHNELAPHKGDGDVERKEDHSGVASDGAKHHGMEEVEVVVDGDWGSNSPIHGSEEGGTKVGN